jgi:hypothetical protein
LNCNFKYTHLCFKCVWQNIREIKNPADLLRRVYDILIFAHITISSPESKYENDDDVKLCMSFLLKVSANIVKF